MTGRIRRVGVARVTSHTEMATRAAAGMRSRSGAEACGWRIACWSAATSSGTVGRYRGSMIVVRSAGSSMSRPVLPYARVTRDFAHVVAIEYLRGCMGIVSWSGHRTTDSQWIARTDPPLLGRYNRLV